MSAGTQVVARIETGDSVARRPSGAVAVIVDSPLDRTHAYRVRFVDGGEESLRRSEFAVRKQHQVDGLGTSVDEAFVTFEPFIILRSVVGSRAYGLHEDDSDTDQRGIFLPPAPRHWSLAGVPEQIERDEFPVGLL